MAALSCLSIRAVEPECVNGLIDENLIPMVRLRSPQTFLLTARQFTADLPPILRWPALLPRYDRSARSLA